MKQDKISTSLIALIAKSLFFCCVFFAFNLSASYGQYIPGDESNISSISSLMSAVHDKDIEGVKFFSNSGRRVVNQQNIGGATALHIAARNNSLEIVQILISNGADVNVSDNDGWTPLMRAALVGNSQIVSELLINGADANKKNSSDETAIVHSATSSCFQCLESVLNYIDYSVIDEDLLNDQFEDAFLVASKKSDTKTKQILNQYKDKIDCEEYPSVFNSNNSDIELLNMPNLKKNKSKKVYSFGKNEEKVGELKPAQFESRQIAGELEKDIKSIKVKNYLFIQGKSWSSSKDDKGSNAEERKVIKFIKNNDYIEIRDVGDAKGISNTKKIYYFKGSKSKEEVGKETNTKQEPKKKIIYKKKIVDEDNGDEKNKEEMKEIEGNNKEQSYSFFKIKSGSDETQEDKPISFFKLKDKAENNVDEEF